MSGVVFDGYLVARPGLWTPGLRPQTLLYKKVIWLNLSKFAHTIAVAYVLSMQKESCLYLFCEQNYLSDIFE